MTYIYKIRLFIVFYSSAFNAGKAAAYGSLCRLMSQRPEEKVPEGYFAAFYKSILKVNFKDFHRKMVLLISCFRDWHQMIIPLFTQLY